MVISNHVMAVLKYHNKWLEPAFKRRVEAHSKKVMAKLKVHINLLIVLEAHKIMTIKKVLNHFRM